MKIGLHAYTYVLAAGLREYQPVVKGALGAAELVSRAARLKCSALQLARKSFEGDPAKWDTVMLMNIGQQAKDAGITLHLSTNLLRGGHLADLVYAAKWLQAPQVTVPLARLAGTVQQRQHALERLLLDLDVAIKTAEKHGIMLAFENGRHTAAADLAAFIQAAQSKCVGVCYDVGNALTVPENPLDSAAILVPLAKCVHLKDWQVFRAREGATLVNCPVGDGVLPLAEIVRLLKAQQPDLLLFLQTGAERVTVPVLDDEFLRAYPRITARAMAGLLRLGELKFSDDAEAFPHERKATEKDVLKWEEDRVKRSLKQALKLIGVGEDSLTLSLE